MHPVRGVRKSLIVMLPLCATLALSPWMREARADASAVRLRAVLADGRLTVRASALVDDALRARVRSGRPTRWVVSVEAIDTATVALERRCAIAEDVWARGYVVMVERDVRRVDDADAALARCLDVVDAPIARAALDHELAVVVRLNPTGRRLSSWLGRADGGVGEPTFFGAVVGRVAFAGDGAERVLVPAQLTVVRDADR